MSTEKVGVLPVATDAAGGEIVITQTAGIDNPESRRIAVATEAEILSPTADEPKLVTNVGLNDKLEEFEKELGVNWGVWTGTDTGGGQTTYPAFGPGNGTIIIDGINIRTETSTFDAKTGAIPPNHKAVLSFSTGPGSNNPPLSSGTLRGGLIWDGVARDGTARRWYYPIDNPEAADGEEFFYLSGSTWVPVAYNGDLTETSYGSLPNDSNFYPISSEAHDGPTTNTFDDEADIGIRVNARQTALRIIYDDTPGNNSFVVVYSHRNYVASASGFTVSGAQANHDLVKSTGADTQSWGKLTNDNVASDAAIAQSKLANIAASDLPSGTLVYTGTPANDRIPVHNGSQWVLEAKPSGGTSLPTTGKADGKVLTATGTGSNDQAWEDAPYVADNLLQGTPVVSTSTATEHSLSGHSWGSYQAFYVSVSTDANGQNDLCISPMIPITHSDKACETPHGTSIKTYDSDGTAKFTFQKQSGSAYLVSLIAVRFK